MKKNTNTGNGTLREMITDSSIYPLDTLDEKDFFRATFKIVLNYLNKSFTPELGFSDLFKANKDFTTDQAYYYAILGGLTSFDNEDPMNPKPMLEALKSPIYAAVYKKLPYMPLWIVEDAWNLIKAEYKLSNFDPGEKYDKEEYFEELTLKQNTWNKLIKTFFDGTAVLTGGTTGIALGVASAAMGSNAYTYEKPVTDEEWASLLLRTWESNEEAARDVWPLVSDIPVSDVQYEIDLQKLKKAYIPGAYDPFGIGLYNENNDMRKTLAGGYQYDPITDKYYNGWNGDEVDKSVVENEEQKAASENTFIAHDTENYDVQPDWVQPITKFGDVEYSPWGYPADYTQQMQGESGFSIIRNFINGIWKSLGGTSANDASPSPGPAPKSSAYGLSYVPYDDFPALLHEGERVLTASEARAYSSGGASSVVVRGNNFTIREEADVEKVAKAIVRQMSRAYAVTG